MLIEFFERDYAHLPDEADASKVITIVPGRYKVGDIRAKCAGYSKDSSIYPESDGRDFYISPNLNTKFFAV